MRWLTLYVPATSQHLSKDVGLLPEYMAQRGHRCILAAAEAIEVPSNFRLRAHALGNRRLGFLHMGALWYLLRTARQVDVLQLYHLRRDTLVYALWFSLLNGRGKIYIKGDVLNAEIEQSPYIYSRNGLKNTFFKVLEKRVLSRIALLTSETPAGIELLKRHYPAISAKLRYLPNGLRFSVPPVLNKQFNRVILSVGTLGAPAKNFESVFELEELLKETGWQLWLCGPETDQFARLRTNHQQSQLQTALRFLGPVASEDELQALYLQASIYLQPSHTESFGLAMLEALSCGCYVLCSTGAGAFDLITRQGQFGSQFERGNLESMKLVLQQALKSGLPEQFNPQEASNYATTEFSYPRIAQKLEDYLRST